LAQSFSLEKTPPKVNFIPKPNQEQPINLSPHQRVKLILHKKCNHINMSTLHHWIQKGLLGVDPSIAKVPDLLCLTYQYGKAKRCSHKSDTGSITASHNCPGTGVSTDQLKAAHPGHVMTTRGLPSPHCYKYCNLWMDHHSKYSFPT